MTYEGKIYRAPSGQWAWLIITEEDDEELARGAGYESEDEALQDMYDELAQYRSRIEL